MIEWTIPVALMALWLFLNWCYNREKWEKEGMEGETKLVWLCYGIFIFCYVLDIFG